jgi:hypothetical protein
VTGDPDALRVVQQLREAFSLDTASCHVAVGCECKAANIRLQLCNRPSAIQCNRLFANSTKLAMPRAPTRGEWDR